MRDKGYAYQTEKTYIHWIKRFILFHGKRHPKDMGEAEINRFLSHLGCRRDCSPATQRIELFQVLRGTFLALFPECIVLAHLFTSATNHNVTYL
jgi:hypothetical protein